MSLTRPYMVLYALHDALVKPMPGQPRAPSPAGSWSVSKDGLVYEFVLRKGALFHNSDPVAADDVQYWLERYRGTAVKALKKRVAGVETLDSGPVRIRLKYPWPDFLAFLNGVGPRVRESRLGLIAGHAYSAPYEDVTLKGK